MRIEAVSTEIGIVYLLIDSGQVQGATLNDEAVFFLVDGEPIPVSDRAGLLLASLAVGDNERWCAMKAEEQVAEFRAVFEV